MKVHRYQAKTSSSISHPIDLNLPLLVTRTRMKLTLIVIYWMEHRAPLMEELEKVLKEMR
jgi:hypothetical protein